MQSTWSRGICRMGKGTSGVPSTLQAGGRLYESHSYLLSASLEGQGHCLMPAHTSISVLLMAQEQAFSMQSMALGALRVISFSVLTDSSANPFWKHPHGHCRNKVLPLVIWPSLPELCLSPNMKVGEEDINFKDTRSQ